MDQDEDFVFVHLSVICAKVGYIASLLERLIWSKIEKIFTENQK